MTALPQGAALDPIALRAQAGDGDALDLFLRAIERLLFRKAVQPVANRHGLWNRQADLEQMAKVAVMRWLPRWLPEKGRATTYLVTNAFWELDRRAKKMTKPVHVPVHALEARRKVPAIQAKAARGQALTDDEQEILDREPYILAAMRAPASIHPHDGEEGGADYLLACRGEEPHEDIRDLLDLLPERERHVVERRFGLVGSEATLEEVATELQVSRERVRQIQVTALERIRAHLRAARHVKMLDAAEGA